MNNYVHQGASGVRVGLNALFMTNTIVADNHGAPALHLNGSATLLNDTIVNGDSGGVLFNPPANADLVITNSIVYSNNGSIMGPGTGTILVAYSDIQDGATGVGNIDADPKFVDAANGDYHLALGSPAVDAGTNTSAPAADFEGDSRPADGDGDGVAIADMGADELVLYQIYLPTVLRN